MAAPNVRTSSGTSINTGWWLRGRLTIRRTLLLRLQGLPLLWPSLQQVQIKISCKEFAVKRAREELFMRDQ
jgi:hypothetical protein